MEPQAEPPAGAVRRSFSLGKACVQSSAGPWSLPDSNGVNFPPQLLPPQLLPDKIATEVAERVAGVVQPVLSQAKESQESLLQVEQALSNVIRKFEATLQGERQLAEGRLQRHEMLLQQHAERVAEATSRLERLERARPLAQAAGEPAAAGASPQRPVLPDGCLGPVEATLERLEAAVARHQRTLEEANTVQSRMQHAAILNRGYSDDKWGRGMHHDVPEKASDGRKGELRPSNSNKSSQDSVPEGPPSPRSGLQAEGDCGPTPRGEPEEASWEVARQRRASCVSIATSALFAPDNLMNSKQVKRFDRSSTNLTIDLGSDDNNRASTVFGMPLEEVKSFRSRTATSFVQSLLTDYVLQTIEWWDSLREPPRRGELAKLIKSRCFEAFCGGVILANAFFIVYTTNTKMFEVEVQEKNVMPTLIGELIFLCWYIMELLLKIIVHRLYFFVGMDSAWNVFDLSLVVVAMYFELFGFLMTGNGGSGNTIALRILRVLRLAKVLRAVRLMRYLTFFSTVRLILNSLIGSWISLFWSMVLLLFVNYLFAVVFVESMTDFLQEGDRPPHLVGDIDRYFGSVETCMVTLFKATFHGNYWDVYYQVLSQTDGINAIMFLFFIGFIHVSVFNIMTAVFVEITMRLAQPDTHAQAHQKRIKERQEAKELRHIVSEVDIDGKGTISALQFQELVENAHMRHCMAVLGLDVRNTEEFFDMLGFIHGSSEVDIDEFVQGCMRMRGGATGLGQQSLLMEAKLMRRAQRDLCLIMTERMDMLSERIPASPQASASSKSPKGATN